MFRLQRISFSNLLLPLTLATGVVLAVCGALYLREANNTAFTALDNENRRMDRFTSLFGNDIASMVSDLRLVSSGDAFQDYLTSGDPAQLARAARRDVFFSNENPDYDQIRYLDETGPGDASRQSWRSDRAPRSITK